MQPIYVVIFCGDVEQFPVFITDFKKLAVNTARALFAYYEECPDDAPHHNIVKQAVTAFGSRSTENANSYYSIMIAHYVGGYVQKSWHLADGEENAITA